MNKRTSRAQVAGMSLVLAVLLVLGAGVEARGQERVFDISALQAQASAGVAGARSSGMQMRTVSTDAGQTARTADAQAGPVLTADRIADFQNLYFNIQPAMYFNADGVNDATKGSPVATVYVQPNQLHRLKNDVLNTAKLLVIEGGAVNGIATLLADDSVLPELEFLLIKSEAGQNALNAQNVNTSLGSSVFENRPDLIVVYNNLELAQ